MKNLVAFIDILGFKKLVEDYFNGTNKDSLPNLRFALKMAKIFAINFSKQNLKQSNITFKFKQFSDCVSISLPVNPKNELEFIESLGVLINVVRSYYMILLDNKILIRGGISIGKHSENKEMIFSEALTKAYKLETEKAIYPRIIIDKEIIDLLNNILTSFPDFHSMLYNSYGDSIIIDWDNELFISPLGTHKLMKIIQKEKGKRYLKEMLNEWFKRNKIEAKFTDKEINAIHSPKFENDSLSIILLWLNNYITDNIDKDKHNVINKYIWLREFIVWYLKPSESSMKFKCYFKK